MQSDNQEAKSSSETGELVKHLRSRAYSGEEPQKRTRKKKTDIANSDEDSSGTETGNTSPVGGFDGYDFGNLLDEASSKELHSEPEVFDEEYNREEAEVEDFLNTTVIEDGSSADSSVAELDTGKREEVEDFETHFQEFMSRKTTVFQYTGATQEPTSPKPITMDQATREAIQAEVHKQIALLIQERDEYKHMAGKLMETVKNQSDTLKQQGPMSAKALADAFKGAKLSTVSSNIEVPKFDTKKMSAKAFLSLVENYFKGMQYDDKQYLAHIITYLEQLYLKT